MFQFLFILIFCFFPFSAIFSQGSIDLKKNCENSICTPRIWYVVDQFSEEFLLEENPVTNKWIPISEFPIWLNKYYKKDSNLADYSLFTKVHISEEMLQNSKIKGIAFGEIGEVFSIYINGKKIASEGKIENGKIIFHRTVRDVVYAIPGEILRSGENSILVHLQGDPKFDHTGFYLTQGYELGILDDLKYDAQNRIGLALLLVYFVIGYYHYFLFLKRPKEKENLLFGTYCVGLSIYLATRSSAIFEFDWDTRTIQKVELIVLYPTSCMPLLFHDFLFFRKLHKITLYYFYFCVALAIPTLFVEMHIAEHILRIWQASALTYIFPITLYIFYRAIKDKIPNAKRLFWFFLSIVIAAIFDILDSAIFNTGIGLSKYTFFIYILGIFTVLANKFMLLHNETEELNLNLEKKVSERTLELSNTLDTVQKLKRQQDGDYFLTSLLIKSLTTKDTISDQVIIKFKVKQKKQFDFQKTPHEIGGDLCRSEEIYLRNKPFTVFFNADAMGKSMQGAGGALVLGAVFDAILERTVLSYSMHSQYPERWLKNAFIELHRVFESFDGSMLVSIVIGLVDNSSGFMYYLNAEHPEIVFYRDGIAKFVPGQFIYRKLGSPITGSVVELQTFQIYPGDKIIIGSDGRDDIYLPGLSDEKELNSDEKLFLKTVEEREGDLDKLFNYYLQNSEILSDDLSLMVIELNSNFTPINLLWTKEDQTIFENSISSDSELLDLWENYLQNKENNPYDLKTFAEKFLDHKLYNQAFRAAKDYIEFDPSDIEMIFIASTLALKTEKFTEAIDLGERVRIRKVDHLPNLVNLAKSYLAMGIKERAEIMISLLEEFDPRYKEISELRMQMHINK